MAAGTTASVPESGSACWSSWGTAGEIVIEVAPVLVHCSVLNCPAVTAAGVAVSVIVGAAPGAGVGAGAGVGDGLGVGGLVAAALPPHAVRMLTRTSTARTGRRGLK